jgi:hypothetical protein
MHLDWTGVPNQISHLIQMELNRQETKKNVASMYMSGIL